MPASHSSPTRRTDSAAVTTIQERKVSSPRLLLLDEPSARVAHQELTALGLLQRQVNQELGVTLRVIDHDMTLLRSVRSRFVALDLGEVIATGTVEEVQSHPVGSRPSSGPPGRPSGRPAPLAYQARRADHGLVGGTSASFLVGPLIAFAVIGILVLLLRWAFRRGGSVVARPATSGRVDEYGLLVSVAAPSNYIEAEIVRRSLEDSRIRATLAHTLAGPRIMVFPDDAERARELLSRGR